MSHLGLKVILDLDRRRWLFSGFRYTPGKRARSLYLIDRLPNLDLRFLFFSPIEYLLPGAFGPRVRLIVPGLNIATPKPLVSGLTSQGTAKLRNDRPFAPAAGALSRSQRIWMCVVNRCLNYDYSIYYITITSSQFQWWIRLQLRILQSVSENFSKACSKQYAIWSGKIPCQPL